MARGRGRNRAYNGLNADVRRAAGKAEAKANPYDVSQNYGGYNNNVAMYEAASRGEGDFGGLDASDQKWLGQLAAAQRKEGGGQENAKLRNLDSTTWRQKSGLNAKNQDIMGRLLAAASEGNYRKTQGGEGTDTAGGITRGEGMPVGGIVAPTPTYTGATGYTEDKNGVRSPTGGGELIQKAPPTQAEQINARPDLQTSAPVPQLAVGQPAGRVNSIQNQMAQAQALRAPAPTGAV
jgi:hypothetical protein